MTGLVEDVAVLVDVNDISGDGDEVFDGSKVEALMEIEKWK